MVIGGIFGAASAFTADICMCAILAWPGGIIAGLLSGEPQMTDHGADMAWVVPTNAAFYAAMAYLISSQLRRTTKTPDAPSCSKCGYCLKGNVSGACPECGTQLERREPFDPL